MPGSNFQIHRSRWLLPVTSQPIENGALVVCNDQIVDLGPWNSVRASFPGTRIIDHGEAVLFPGLVNCHTHLDNSALKDKLPRKPDNMTDWLMSHIATRQGIAEEEKNRSLEQQWQQLWQFGTAALGDITYARHSLIMAAASPIDSWNFLEVIGFNKDRALENLKNAQALLQAQTPSGIRLALTPHALHTLHKDVLLQVFDLCRKAGSPVSLHLCESSEEIEFMHTGTGPYRRLLETWGYWEESFSPPGCSPVEFLHRNKLLSPRLMAVHCVHLSAEERQLLKENGVNICLCPRSNDYIDNGQPDISALQNAGINLSLGTDGLASNDSLSLFDEMQFIRDNHPAVSPSQLLEMATINGAHSLQLDSLLGSLEKNKLARFLIYKGYNGNSPVEAITGIIQPDLLHWAGGDIEREEKRAN